MRSLKGRSGVVHTFTEAATGPSGKKVVELFDVQLTELDVIRVYAKVLDVGACSVDLVAPSYTLKARELAESYGMTLKIPVKLSR